MKPLSSHHAQLENTALTQLPNRTGKKIDVKRRKLSDDRWLQSSRARTGSQDISSERLSIAPLGFMAERLRAGLSTQPALQKEVLLKGRFLDYEFRSLGGAPRSLCLEYTC